MDRDALARAIDHFADAARFLKEALLETERGRSVEAKRFVDLAQKSAHDGEFELRGQSRKGT